MTSDEAAEKAAAGMIPFVHCNHGAGMEPAPASFNVSPFGLLVTCTQCLREKVHGELWWVTPQQAQERYGWSVVPDEP